MGTEAMQYALSAESKEANIGLQTFIAPLKANHVAFTSSMQQTNTNGTASKLKSLPLKFS